MLLQAAVRLAWRREEPPQPALHHRLLLAGRGGEPGQAGLEVVHPLAARDGAAERDHNAAAAEPLNVALVVAHRDEADVVGAALRRRRSGSHPGAEVDAVWRRRVTRYPVPGIPARRSRDRLGNLLEP